MNSTKIIINVFVIVVAVALLSAFSRPQTLFRRNNETNSVETTDKSTNEIIEFDDNDKLRGSILSSEGIEIVHTFYSNDNTSHVWYREANPDLSVCFSNIIGTFTEVGIDNALETELRCDNPIPTDDNAIGKSARLTLNAANQKKVYDIMWNEKNIVGSVTVMDTRSGTLNVMLSTPSYDMNKFRTDNKERVKIINTEAVTNKAAEPIILPVSLLESYMNKKFSVSDFNAISDSCINQILRDEFLIDEETSILTDFADMNCSFDISNMTLSVSPVMLSAIYASFFNGGKIMEPHVLDCFVDTVSGETVGQPFSPNILSELSTDISKEMDTMIPLLPLNDGSRVYGDIICSDNGWVVYGIVKTVKPTIITLTINDTSFDGISSSEDVLMLYKKIADSITY